MKMYICNNCGLELLEPYCTECESNNVDKIKDALCEGVENE